MANSSNNGTEPHLLEYRILFEGSVTSAAMSSECRELYRSALLDDLTTLSRTVNYRICTGAMCPYLSGAPGGGVPVDGSSHVVFVAINTEALINAVSFSSASTVGSHGRVVLACSPVVKMK